jgi:hypothetical protein
MNIASSDLVMRSTRLSYSEALLKYDGRSDAEARWLDSQVPTTLLLDPTSELNVWPWRDYGMRGAVCQGLRQVASPSTPGTRAPQPTKSAASPTRRWSALLHAAAAGAREQMRPGTEAQLPQTRSLPSTLRKRRYRWSSRSADVSDRLTR